MNGIFRGDRFKRQWHDTRFRKVRNYLPVAQSWDQSGRWFQEGRLEIGVLHKLEKSVRYYTLRERISNPYFK